MRELSEFFETKLGNFSKPYHEIIPGYGEEKISKGFLNYVFDYEEEIREEEAKARIRKYSADPYPNRYGTVYELTNLVTFFIANKYTALVYNEHINFTKEMTNNFPIFEISEETEKSLIDIVNQILEMKQTKPDVKTTDSEKQIDQLVYKLCGLIHEEIKIVEGSTNNKGGKNHEQDVVEGESL